MNHHWPFNSEIIHDSAWFIRTALFAAVLHNEIVMGYRIRKQNEHWMRWIFMQSIVGNKTCKCLSFVSNEESFLLYLHLVNDLYLRQHQKESIRRHISFKNQMFGVSNIFYFKLIVLFRHVKCIKSDSTSIYDVTNDFFFI